MRARGPRVHRRELLVVEVAERHIGPARHRRNHGARRLEGLQVRGLAHEQHGRGGRVRRGGEAEAHMVGRAVGPERGHRIAPCDRARRHRRAFPDVVPRRPAVARRVDAAGREVVAVVVGAGEEPVGVVGIDGDGRFVLGEAGLVLVRHDVGADTLRRTGRVARILRGTGSGLVLQGGIDGHDAGEVEHVIVTTDQIRPNAGRHRGLRSFAAGPGDQRASRECEPAVHRCLLGGFDAGRGKSDAEWIPCGTDRHLWHRRHGGLNCRDAGHSAERDESSIVATTQTAALLQASPVAPSTRPAGLVRFTRLQRPRTVGRSEAVRHPK